MSEKFWFRFYISIIIYIILLVNHIYNNYYYKFSMSFNILLRSGDYSNVIYFSNFIHFFKTIHKSLSSLSHLLYFLETFSFRIALPYLIEKSKSEKKVFLFLGIFVWISLKYSFFYITL